MNFRDHTRTIIERIIVKGTLVLDSPCLISSGDNDDPLDMPLLRDSIEERALIPGTSLAGALREYLATLYPPPSQHEEAAEIEQLLGATQGDADGAQSALLISDALSNIFNEHSIELRDGVRIDQATRTAADAAKYDLETLSAGTTFELEFELLITADHNRDSLVRTFATALHGLQSGVISLGMKKSRGLGRCHVAEWQVWRFDMTTPAAALNWLRWCRDCTCTAQPDIADSLSVALPTSTTAKTTTAKTTLTATFTFADDALLIRSGQDLVISYATPAAQGATDAQTEDNKGTTQPTFAPDAVHLYSRSADTHQPQPIIPGTSWAGVLRHRAVRILNTLKQLDADTPQQDDALIRNLFGYVDEPTTSNDQSSVQPASTQPRTQSRSEVKAQASRISIDDSVIYHPKPVPLVQNRIAIDRFTGGAYHGALFSEQPVWKQPSTEVTLTIGIKPAPPPTSNTDQATTQPLYEPEAEIGLLLLLLKDIWTADLPVGGTSSIGRGRLSGISAKLCHNGTTWKIAQAEGNALNVTSSAAQPDPRESLQTFVASLLDYVNTQPKQPANGDTAHE